MKIWYRSIIAVLFILIAGCNQNAIRSTSTVSTSNQKGIEVTRVRVNQEQGRRVALIIGNAHYEHASELTSPINDASDIAEALNSLDFDVVYDHYDASKETMDSEINRFLGQLRGDDMAVFYYSGHGMEINGRNYFIPVEANINLNATNARNLEQDVEKKAILASNIVDGISRAKSSLVILDACRNNFLPPGSKSLGQKVRVNVKSITGGSAPLTKSLEGEGDMVILYATTHGAPAFDGQGRNSLFTKHLLRGLKDTSLTINQLTRQVTKEVVRESKEKYGEMQKPWVYGTVTEDRCLARTCQAVSSPPAQLPSQPLPTSPIRDDTTPPPPPPV